MTRTLLFGLALLVVTSACRKEEDPLQQLLNPRLDSPEAVMNAVTQRSGTPQMDLPRPPATGEPNGAPVVVVSGTVLETMDASSYTYLRLKLPGGEEWAAVPKMVVNVGDAVSVQQSMVMTEFHSSTLNRTFPRIIFGTLAMGSAAPAPAAAMPPGHPPTPSTPATTPAPSGDGALSGTVLETLDAASYTYVRLKLDDGTEEWAAVPQTALAKGSKVSLATSVVMNDFHSATLKRTFPRVVFATVK